MSAISPFTMRFLAGALLGSGFLLAACQPQPPQCIWQRAEEGLYRHALVTAVAPHPANPGEIWLSYYERGGLAVSMDGGRTWAQHPEAFSETAIFDLLIMPNGGMWAATRDGVFRSGDGGVTWQPAGEGLPVAAAFALAADAHGRLYVGLDEGGVFSRSPEQGAVWQRVARYESLASATVLSLEASPDGQQLYAGTSGMGIFASDDGGREWHQAFTGDYIPAVVVSPQAPSLAVATLRNRLALSTDGGRAWQEATPHWAHEHILSLLWANDSLWAGSGAGGVYRSPDGGLTWERAEPSLSLPGGVTTLVEADDRLLAGTWVGLYTAGPGDTDWRHLSSALGSPQANTLLAVGDRLYLGTRAGLYEWRADAARWMEVDAHLPPGGVTALAVMPGPAEIPSSTPDGPIYAGTAAHGVWRSLDGGDTWEKVEGQPLFGIRAVAVNPNDGDRLYALAAWERPYESVDGGLTWHALWEGLDVTVETVSLALGSHGPLELYLGTDRGLYRSSASPVFWQPILAELADHSGLVVATRPAPDALAGSRLYIGTTRGLYRSDDGGDSAVLLGKGLEDKSVTALLFHPWDERIIYAGTAFSGLYRTEDGGLTWQPVGPVELRYEVVESLAWGPDGEVFIAARGGVWLGSCQSEPSECSRGWW